MSRRILPILLVAAVALYAGGIAGEPDTSVRDATLNWSGESFDLVPTGTAPTSPKAPALAPASLEILPPSEELLHPRPSVEDWGQVSMRGRCCWLSRSPPRS